MFGWLPGNAVHAHKLSVCMSFSCPPVYLNRVRYIRFSVFIT